MPIQEVHNRNEVKKISFHHKVKRFYHKNLFRKIYTIAIIGLIGANIFSMVKYASFADELLGLEQVSLEEETIDIDEGISEEPVSPTELENPEDGEQVSQPSSEEETLTDQFEKETEIENDEHNAGGEKEDVENTDKNTDKNTDENIEDFLELGEYKDTNYIDQNDISIQGEKDTTTTLLTGKDFNAKINKLSGQSSTNYSTNNYSIKNIQQTGTLIASPTEDNIISTPGSDYPTYARFDSSDGTIYYYTDAEKIQMNADSSHMFSHLPGLSKTSDFGSWDTSNVTNMSYMFGYATINSELDLSSWDTSNVTNMSYMFGYATINSGLNLSSWEINSGVSLSNMFEYTTINSRLNLSSWEINSGVSFSYMFEYTTINSGLNLSGLVASNATDMSDMFYGAIIKSNLDFSDWDTSNVTNMSKMFQRTNVYSGLNLSGLDTSRVSDMSYMFSYAQIYSGLDLSSWDTSSVTSMKEMFNNATINSGLNLTNWDTSSVTNMNQIFYRAKIPTIYATTGFDTSKVTSSSDLFTKSKVVGGNGTVCNTALDTSYLRIDGAEGLSGCFTELPTATLLPGGDFNVKLKKLSGQSDATYQTQNTSIKNIVRASTPIAGLTDDNIISTSDSVYPIYARYDNGTIYYHTEADIIKLNNDSSYMFSNMKGGFDILNISGWDTSNVTNMNYMFNGVTINSGLDLSNWDTSNVTNMNYMFFYASIKSELDLNNWEINTGVEMNFMFGWATIKSGLNLSNRKIHSGVMQYMFNNATIESGLNLSNRKIHSGVSFARMFQNASINSELDLSNLDTSCITSMRCMFKNASINSGINLSNWIISGADVEAMFSSATINTNLDLSDWKINRGSSFSQMFYGATIKSGLDLSSWEINNGAGVGGIFYYTTINSGLNLSSWEINSGASLSDMFYGATIKSGLDLSNWGINSGASLSSMFNNATINSELDLSSWDVSGVTSMSSMFNNATINSGLNLSSWDTSSVTLMSSMFYNAKIPIIYATSGFDTSNVTSSSNLFTKSKVVGGNGTVCNTALDTSYLRIDGDGGPGCFTFYNPCEAGYYPDDGQCINSKTGACTMPANPDSNGVYANTGDYIWNVARWEAPECTVVSCNGKSFKLNDGTCAVFNDLELYFLQSDGSTGHYTIMDRNLGATEVYNGTWGSSYVSTNSGSYGYYYKWGNNTGFVKGDANFDSAPEIIVNSWSTNNQGPCPTGYHVPTALELATMVGQRNLGKNHSIQKFALDWLLPPSGSYSDTDGTHGLALSSTRLSTNHIYYLLYDSRFGVSPNFVQLGTYGLPVRCMKDSTNAGISINPDGGTTAVVAFTGTVGNGRFTTLDAPTRADGAIFDGWYDENDNKVETGDIVVSDLYAKWTVRYTVTFDATANGGTTSTPIVEVTPGETVNLSGYTATKIGYDFLGWSTTSGSHTPISTNYNNYPVTSDITLYAIFKKVLTATFLKDDTVQSISNTPNTCTMWNNETTCSIDLPSITCKSGYYSPSWSNSTTDISSDVTTTASCTTCEAGYYCPSGSEKVACSTLGSNYTSVAGATGSTSCYMNVSAGSYKTSANGNTTQGCGAGKYSEAHTSYYSSEDSNACKTIQAGCFGTSASSACPNQCVASSSTQAGGYSSEGSASCTVAGDGYYVQTNGATEKSDCPEGSYCDGGKIGECPNGYTSPTKSSQSSQCYKTITATFNLNGASKQTNQGGSAVSDSSVTRSCDLHYGSNSCNITTPTITAVNGFNVLGYNTFANATESILSHNTQTSISDDSMVYYAITQSSSPITITFNANGNQINTQLINQTNENIVQECYRYNGSGSCAIISPNILSVNGFSVIGWSTNTNRYSDDWTPNTSKDVTTNDTYYAQTKKDGYTVNVSYTKGNGVKSIGKTSNSCNVVDIYNGVEYQSCEVTMPSITCKSGYGTPQWNNGESGNTDISVLSDTSYEATCLASDDTRYTVNHYQQNIKDNNYTLFETESKTGTTDTKTQAVAKNYQGFKSKSFTQKDIQGDNETVVDIYYDRNEYKVTFYDEDGETVLKSMKKYRYGTKVADMEVPSPTKPASGTNTYVFNGWLPQLGDVQKDVEYIAQYRVVAPSQTNNYSGGGRRTNSNTNKHNSAETNNEKTTSKDTPIELNNDTKDDTSVKSPEGQNEKTSQEDSKGQKIDLDTQRYDSTYTTEQNQAYHFAKSNGITTTPSIKEAKMNTPLTRIEMAKMLSYYAVNVLGQRPQHGAGVANFADVPEGLDEQYDYGVGLAYQLGIMGQNMPENKFRPYDRVTRGEFATALSRMIYGMEDGKGKLKYYEPHIARLYNEGIINNTNPKMLEQRGYVMTMLMRTVK